MEWKVGREGQAEPQGPRQPVLAQALHDSLVTPGEPPALAAFIFLIC